MTCVNVLSGCKCIHALLGRTMQKSVTVGAFHERVEPQVTKRTIQQCRPQIRVTVTGCQIVNADHVDCVQDDNLT